jgi:bifunctional non-homologous end joining protein LigD
MPLDEYHRKRKFRQTPEPAGKPRRDGDNAKRPAGGRFVVQKHAARRLHYDLRLEIDGVLKSWAVPKGPSLNPKDKRLAVMTEDHPLEYGNFEGTIPEGNYGAGTVIIWDTGEYAPEGERSPSEQVAGGEIKFVLRGKKLAGSFVLVKLKPRADSKGNEWLLIKHDDAHADESFDADALPDSAVTGRTLDEVRQGLPPDQAGQLPLAALEGAAPAPMPREMEPMLGTLVQQPFSDPDWLFELKWDGVRALAFIDDGKCRLRSRMGHDMTDRYPELMLLPELLAGRQAVLDGEIVVLDEQGRGDFERLQSRMHVSKPARGQIEQAPATYYVFDLLYLDGYDLRPVALVERKRLLRQVLRASEPVRYSDHVLEKGKELFELARRHGAEGVVGKRLHSRYVAGRATEWVKLKVTSEVDAVVGGYTSPSGGRQHFGALLLGLYEGGQLNFIGAVGSGFNDRTLAEIAAEIDKRKSSRRPFPQEPVTKGKPHWIKPELVARVQYGSWTQEKRLRAPVFGGLRWDIDPKDCRLETETAAPAAIVKARPVSSVPVLASRDEIEKELFEGERESVILEITAKPVRLTNLNKIYFPEARYTKRDLIAYYYRVAEYLLPFMKDRPLVLQRFPNGIKGNSFYQKDAGPDTPPWMDTHGILSEERGRDIQYLMAQDLAGLLYLANLGCIEMHPWSSSIGNLDNPDYVFFDLDPTEGTDYDTVIEVARTILKVLDRLKVRVFLKTSGASGFHMYLPLEPRYGYEQARVFAEIVARMVAAQIPKKVTLERLTGRRSSGEVYLDYSQNAYGRPLATVYSVRPQAAASVSAPVTAKELRRGLRPDHFTIKTMPERLKKTGDLWAGFWEHRQRIEPALDRLRREISKRKIVL